MPDRENVINRMETICNICKEKTWRTEFSSDTIYPLLQDALALLKEQEEEIENLKQTCQSMMEGAYLLKEQEAVVHPEPSCEMTYITDCCCDLCGVQLIREDNFCRCCGKRIEWESR